MLVSFWSPKGGVGTSVLAAACGVVLARHTPVRLADFGGDQPAVFGTSGNHSPGLSEWLLTGPEAPADALDRLAIDVAGLSLLPAGDCNAVDASPEAGAALGVVLANDERLTVADVGGAGTAALQAVVEVSDVSVLVVRDCYLAVRRAAAHPMAVHAAGVVVVEEGRSLHSKHIVEVLRLPLLGEVPLRPDVARAVDAGVLAARLPKSLERSARRIVERLGLAGRAGRAA